MANVCEFEMMLRGTKENIDKFVDALSQKDNVWMGRGAYITSRFDDEAAHSAMLCGECKWSMQSSLIDNAISMRAQENGGQTIWADIPEGGEFLTIFEACEKYSVNMEAYSKEPGCEFQEHLICENGKVVNDTVDYTEEWDETWDHVYTTGGYPSWDFSVADVA